MKINWNNLSGKSENLNCVALIQLLSAAVLFASLTEVHADEFGRGSTSVEKKTACAPRARIFPNLPPDCGSLEFCRPDGSRVENMKDASCMDILTLKLRRQGVGKLRKGLKQNATILEGIDAAEAEVNDRDVELFSQFISLRLLNLSHAAISGKAVLALSALPFLQTLDLSNTEIESRDLEPLGKIKSLAVLNLSRTNIDNLALRHLALKNNWQELKFHRDAVGGKGIQSLKSSVGLRVLDLGGTEVGNADLKAIAGFSLLQELDLSNTEIDDKSVADLAGLKHLSSLDLSGTKVTETGVTKLLRSMPELKSLKLSKSAVTSRGVKPIALAACAKSALQSLSLSDLDTLDSSSFSELYLLKSIKYLDISGTSFNDKALAAIKAMPSLEYLNLSRTDLRNPDFTNLARFQKLRRLALADTLISEKSLETMSKCNTLEEIELYGTDVGDSIFPYLAKLTKLRKLDLFRTKVSSPAAQRFIKARRGVQVIY